MTRELEARVELLERRLADLERATGLFATNAELDAPRGNGVVKFDPKKWRGAPHKDRRWSECDPAFLDIYAEAIQYSAEHPKEGREKYASYDKRDAKLCRTWARRLRAQAAKAAAEASAPQPEPDPFAADLPSDKFIVGRDSAPAERASVADYDRSGQAARDTQAWADADATPDERNLFDEPFPED